jgi:(R,R)-butanediol dehydrogenase / meso-butanediol dehydrogenase / diacetyl reductase
MAEQAVVYTGAGVLELVPRGRVSAGAGEVVIDVHRVGICGTDLLLWGGGLERVQPPVVIGHEFCGRVAAPGEVGLAPGTPVAVRPTMSCGECDACSTGTPHVCRRLRLIGIDADGAATGSVVVPVENVTVLPTELSLDLAVLVEPVAVAVHMVDRAGVRPGDRVVILGGGPVGALISRVCAAMGVTVVVSEPNARRAELIAGDGITVLSPDSGVDGLIAASGGAGYDVVFEVAGVPATTEIATRLVRPRGTVLLGAIPGSAKPIDIAAAVMKEVTLVASRVYEAADFDAAVRILTQRPEAFEGLITRVVPLSRAVEDAFELLRGSRDEMKIVIEP